VSRPLRVFAAGLFAASAAFTAACGRHANSGSDVASQGGAAVDAGSAGDSDAGSPPDGGAVADAGNPPDAGPAPDGGPATDACVAPDAGAPPALEVLPCPAPPPVLWSRTFSQVDVSLAARRTRTAISIGSSTTRRGATRIPIRPPSSFPRTAKMAKTGTASRRLDPPLEASCSRTAMSSCLRVWSSLLMQPLRVLGRGRSI